jgi:hypothetical protein
MRGAWRFFDWRPNSSRQDDPRRMRIAWRQWAEAHAEGKTRWGEITPESRTAIAAANKGKPKIGETPCQDQCGPKASAEGNAAGTVSGAYCPLPPHVQCPAGKDIMTPEEAQDLVANWSKGKEHFDTVRRRVRLRPGPGVTIGTGGW